MKPMSCPMPHAQQMISSAHGGGGKIMQKLIQDIFYKTFGQSDDPHDGVILNIDHDSHEQGLPKHEQGSKNLVMTTDSFVVSPIFFPGGDIGTLAVHGTINDLVVSGARPKYLSVAFILEEGLLIDDLQRVATSMKMAADACDVKIVTGDTKVISGTSGTSGTGGTGGLMITTTGIGYLISPMASKNIQSGDSIILVGDIGRHGMAIMSVREGLEFQGNITSDTRSLSHPILQLLKEGIDIHCMRDATRGGLAAVLNELSESSNKDMLIYEQDIPVDESVKGACEILGIDPLVVANEGAAVLFVPSSFKDSVLSIVQRYSIPAHVIGKVQSTTQSVGQPQVQHVVELVTLIGGTRIVDMPSGKLLPRIC